MAVHTHLLSFSGLHDRLKKTDYCRSVLNEIDDLLKPFDLKKAHIHENDTNFQNGIHALYVGADGLHAMLSIYPTAGLITLNIQEFLPKESAVHRLDLNETVIEHLEKSIQSALTKDGFHKIGVRSKVLPAIRRGEEHDVYYPLVDGRLVEYDFDAEVYHEKSEYQDILIMHSESFGNVLILDGDVNMAESDILYSETLMQRGKHSYKGKTCLILGGGDGGLLHEILEEGPKMVTMVDVDEMVVNAAKVHLRGICFESLDNYNGPNHEVIIGDAVQLLKSYVSEGRQFDYVVYDLTAVPVKCESDAIDDWQFHHITHNLALAVLADDGVYFTQANALGAKYSLQMYNDLLGRLETPVKWTTHEAFIPSYHEVWVFYEIWKSASKTGDI